MAGDKHVKEIKTLQKRIAQLEKVYAKHTKTKNKLEEARLFATNMIETVRQPLIVLDGNLKVILANKFFYTTFKVSPKQTQGRFIYNLGNKQWDIPKLRQLLTEIITKKNVFDDYEIEHKFQSIGQKTMLLNARRIPPTPAKPRIILLAIEDITERKKRQKYATGRLEWKVRERTRELDAVNQQLKEKVSELEIFNKAAVGRELKIIELRKEIEELRKKVK